MRESRPGVDHDDRDTATDDCCTAPQSRDIARLCAISGHCGRAGFGPYWRVGSASQDLRRSRRGLRMGVVGRVLNCCPRHIAGSMHVPSSTHDTTLPELVRRLADKETVVFHCMLSQQRGPSAALKYARERERLLGSSARTAQEVVILQGGFDGWVQR